MKYQYCEKDQYGNMFWDEPNGTYIRCTWCTDNLAQEAIGDEALCKECYHDAVNGIEA